MNRETLLFKGKGLVLAVIIFLTALAFPAYPGFAEDSDGRVVEVEGTGKVINDDFARGRNEAIRDALRRAVAEAYEAWLPPGLPAKKIQAAKDALNAQAESYVQDYRIISEKSSKNIYSVVVRATVSAGNVRKDLQAQGFIRPQQPAGATVPVTITIYGLASYGDYVKFRELLRSGFGGVRSLSERQIEWKTARLELQITGTAKSLAADLASKSGLPLNIRKVDKDCIEIAVYN